MIDPQLRDRESLLSNDMGLDTSEEINGFPRTSSHGLTFFQTLRKEPWGAKTFIVKDPDGNLLLFWGPAERCAPGCQLILAAPGEGRRHSGVKFWRIYYVYSQEVAASCRFASPNGAIALPCGSKAIAEDSVC